MQGPENPYFCKLTLTDDSEIEILSSGEISNSHISQYFDNIKSIDLGKLCTSVSTEFLYGCSTLQSVSMTNATTIRNGGEFGACSSLSSITITKNLLIGDGFLDRTNLSEITFLGNCNEFTAILNERNSRDGTWILNVNDIYAKRNIIVHCSDGDLTLVWNTTTYQYVIG